MAHQLEQVYISQTQEPPHYLLIIAFAALYRQKKGKIPERFFNAV